MIFNTFKTPHTARKCGGSYGAERTILKLSILSVFELIMNTRVNMAFINFYKKIYTRHNKNYTTVLFVNVNVQNVFSTYDICYLAQCTVHQFVKNALVKEII